MWFRQKFHQIGLCCSPTAPAAAAAAAPHSLMHATTNQFLYGDSNRVLFERSRSFLFDVLNFWRQYTFLSKMNRLVLAVHCVKLPRLPLFNVFCLQLPMYIVISRTYLHPITTEIRAGNYSIEKSKI